MIIVAAIMKTTTDALAAMSTSMPVALCDEVGVDVMTSSMSDVLCVAVGVTTLVEVGIAAQVGSLVSLILTGQLGSNVTVKTSVVNVAPCLTQSSI